ncbi:bifunctional metallophosphatase/5'-nucleotidase [Piscinibacter sakaiensis]|nr:bifunctional metallophosphatase/5'-nucleotidase [Piscinibacter sakaiensis]
MPTLPLLLSSLRSVRPARPGGTAASPGGPSRLRRLGAAAALAAATLAGTGVVPPAQAAEPVPLRLIAFNDFHGNLEAAQLNLVLADPAAPGRTLRVPVGGAAALAGLVTRLRDGAPNALLLSSGDLIGAAPLISTLFHHESTIDLMNRIGLDLNAAGNHEFDAGIDELRRLYAGGCAAPTAQAAVTSCAMGPWTGARFPLLAANVLGRGGRPALAPYVVRQVQGIPVGFIGAVTRSTPSIVVPSGVAGLRFVDEAQAINRSAAELRRRGVRALVAVVHEGGEVGPPGRRADWNDETCPQREGPVFEMARQLDRAVGVVFSAHTHQGYRCVIDGRVVIQATSYGRGVSVVDLALDPATRALIPARTRSINLPVLNEATDADPAARLRERIAAGAPEPYAAVLRVTRPDPAIAERVAEYARIVAPKAGQPVGRIGGRFTRSAAPGAQGDSAAGRLVADAQLAATRDPARGGAQLALMNPGGIRTDLDCGPAPCEVSFGQAFSMQPFGNSLVVMTLSGAQLKALLESQQRGAMAEPSFLQPSAGLSYRWLAKAPAGERVQDLRLDGQPISPDQRLRVTVNSFLAEGGDGFVLLREGRERLGGLQDLDALIAHLKTGPAPQPQPRIAWVP